MTKVTDLGPLDWRIGIVDKTGRPTPEFQRRWNTQRNNNALIGTITFGTGVPPATPVPDDGAEYIDTTNVPAILYVGQNGVWLQVGPIKFTDLLDVPHSYTGLANALAQVKSTEDGLQFAYLSSIMDNVFGYTKGDILVRDTSNWVALPAGTSSDVFTSNGPGTVPSWQAPAFGTQVHFGSGAPSTTYTDGDLYFDTSASPYAGYVQNSGSWNAFGGGTAPPSGTPHRYWRLLIYNLAASGGPWCNQIYLNDTTNTNRAPSATLTSSFGSYSGSLSYLNDGIGTNTWGGSGSVPGSTFTFDFGVGNAYNIASWGWKPGGNTQNPEWHALQYSDDGTTWTDLAWGYQPSWSTTVATTWTVPASPAGTHKWWGLTCLSSSSGGDYSASELEIRATVGGSTQCTGGTAFGFVYYPGLDPSNLFDNNLSTYWAAGGYGYGIPVGYEFTAPVKNAQIAISSEPSNYNKTPSSFEVIYSDDGFSWGVSWPETGVSWSSGGQTLTFNNPN